MVLGCVQAVDPDGAGRVIELVAQLASLVGASGCRLGMCATFFQQHVQSCTTWYLHDCPTYSREIATKLARGLVKLARVHEGGSAVHIISCYA
jgi:hypothetical protein